MAKRHRKRRARELTGMVPLAPGLAPGTLIVPEGALAPEIDIIAYNAAEMVERRITGLQELPELMKLWPVLWVNVAGLGDADLIAKLGEMFRLHRLALEDVLDVRQRAKVEDYPNHLFCITRMTGMAGHELETEQLSLFLGHGFVITVQETPGDCFDPVRERLRRNRGRLRLSGPDYLCYAILDSIIDSYFPVLERLGERLEEIEEDALTRSTPHEMAAAHGIKRDLLILRRSVWPLREAVNSLIRDESPRFASETRLYLRDCYDHVIQILEIIETYRDVTGAVVETCLSSASNRMNEVMKVLTIISTIFIPLSFIASLYGMNFDPDASPWNMPELRWVFGYPAALLLMLSTALALLFFFSRKGWLSVLSPNSQGSPPPSRRRDSAPSTASKDS